MEVLLSQFNGIAIIEYSDRQGKLFAKCWANRTKEFDHLVSNRPFIERSVWVTLGINSLTFEKGWNFDTTYGTYEINNNSDILCNATSLCVQKTWPFGILNLEEFNISCTIKVGFKHINIVGNRRITVLIEHYQTRLPTFPIGTFDFSSICCDNPAISN